MQFGPVVSRVAGRLRSARVPDVREVCVAPDQEVLPLVAAELLQAFVVFGARLAALHHVDHRFDVPGGGTDGQCVVDKSERGTGFKFLIRLGALSAGITAGDSVEDRRLLEVDGHALILSLFQRCFVVGLRFLADPVEDLFRVPGIGQSDAHHPALTVFHFRDLGNREEGLIARNREDVLFPVQVDLGQRLVDQAAYGDRSC